MSTERNFNNEENRERPLQGKLAVVTGASRGIGAEIALGLARRGVVIIAPHRDASKERRATEIANAAEEIGGFMIAPVIDITKPTDRKRLAGNASLLSSIESGGVVDILIHNAAGGLERWADEDYPRQINSEAKVELTKELFPLMSENAIVVDILSLWSLYYGRDITQLPEYEVIAKTKKEGELRLRKLIPELNRQFNKNVKLGFVCGHAVEGTPTVMGFRRKYPEEIAAIEKTAVDGKLPTVGEMADGVVRMLLSNFENGQIEFVGVPNWNKEQVREKLWMYSDETRYVDSIVFVNSEKSFGYLTVTGEHTRGHFNEGLEISLCPGHKMVEAAAQSLGLTFLQNKSGDGVPLFKGITGPIQFLQPVLPGETLEIESTIIDKNAKNFTGNVILRVKDSEVARINGISGTLVQNPEIAKRMINMAVFQREKAYMT